MDLKFTQEELDFQSEVRRLVERELFRRHENKVWK